MSFAHMQMLRLPHIVLWLLLGLQFSCNNGADQQPVASAPAAHPEISRDGVHIDYTENGKGDTTLLFLHGWAIDKTYWDAQVAHFAGKYRVVTVDLPGFGKSGHNRTGWTVEDYGKDVGTVMTQLDLHNVILIGHSMSGAIIVETALRNPGRVIGLVGVDNFKYFGVVPTHADSVGAENFYKMARTHFHDAVSDYVNKVLFSPSTPLAVRQRVLKDMTGADSTIAIDILQRNDDYLMGANLVAVKKSLCLINSSFTPTDTVGFRKKGVDYTLYDIGPTGHYPMIEKPDSFNVLLGEAIDKIGAAR